MNARPTEAAELLKNIGLPRKATDNSHMYLEGSSANPLSHSHSCDAHHWGLSSATVSDQAQIYPKTKSGHPRNGVSREPASQNAGG